MHPSHRRLVYLLAATLGTVWTLALVAMLEHTGGLSGPSPPASAPALSPAPDACDHAAARTGWPIWRLRTPEARAPAAPERSEGRTDRPAAPERSEGRTDRPAAPERSEGRTDRPVRAVAIPTGPATVGLLVCDVSADDPLHAVGVRDEDVLIGVDGTRAISPHAALAIYSQIVTGDARSIAVRRDGALLRLEPSINLR